MNNIFEFNELVINPIRFSSKHTKKPPFLSQRINSVLLSLKKPILSIPASRIGSSRSNQLKTSTSEAFFPISKPQYFEEPPNLSIKTPFNERYLWKKRKLGKRPLLIIVFEGVLGFYSKPTLWSSSKATFTLREDFTSGITELRKHFYVVLISTYSKTVTKELISLLENRQNLVDAVYIQRHKALQSRCSHDVSAILEDFGVKNKAAVIGICALGIENSEIMQRTGQQLVVEKSVSKHKQYLTYFAPACEKDCPVTILVAHCEFLNKFQSVLDIAEFLIGFRNSQQDFFVAFERFLGVKVRMVFREGCNKFTGFFQANRRFVVFSKESEGVARPVTSEFSIRTFKKVEVGL